ncbi:MAG TPA: NUDIX hydrolase [Candidatus Saccharimonadales bacterium]|nr:NUDIX hydrolase [Candidatus Saccharimonadales bacterium]
MTDTTEDGIRTQAATDGVTHFATGLAVARDNKILIVRRAAHDWLGGVYELPGGGVDDGETIAEGAIRELQEETGLAITKILDTFDGFDYSTDHKPRVRQINFLVEVAPGEVVLDPNEHDEYQWVDESSYKDVAVSPEIQKCLAVAFHLLRQTAKS